MTELNPASTIQARALALVEEIERVIVGKREVVELVAVALLARGHVLVDDIPGVGKTTLAKSLARALGCDFKRIQFTPDLLPGDLTGVSIFNQKTHEFEFHRGPVFTSVLLADEINRATPKTQSSLLECMDELQVSVDGITHALTEPFFVIATQNPIEYRGTFPLPEAQLDRFLLRLRLGYTSPAEEVQILDRQQLSHPVEAVQPVLAGEEVVRLQTAVRKVFVAAAVKEYVVALVTATRQHPAVALGASPRGSLALLRSAQALAALQGRSFVVPDDVKRLAEAVLSHRVLLRGESDDGSGSQVIDDALRSVPVPVMAK